MLTLHIGVGSALLPAGNDIVNAKTVPETVPESVPILFLWHDAHVPSAGLTAFVTAVPETTVPVCVSTNPSVNGPCESDPVPVQVPPTVI